MLKMHLYIYLLFLSGFGLMISIGLLFTIFIKNGHFNIHCIWDMVLSGDALARTYFGSIIAAFLSAVVSVILIKLGV